MNPKWHFKINHSHVETAEKNLHGPRQNRSSTNRRALSIPRFAAQTAVVPKKHAWAEKAADFEAEAEAVNVSSLR